MRDVGIFFLGMLMPYLLEIVEAWIKYHKEQK